MELAKNKQKSGDGRTGMNYTGLNVQQMTKPEKKKLEPLLQRMLPRRAKGIERSGYYRQLRIKLLPRNPYFLQDVTDLRRLFNIPTMQRARIDLTRFANRKAPWDKIDELDPEDTAGFWLEIHRHHFLGVPLGDWIPPLPQWLTDSSHIMPVFGEKAQISWLQKEPIIPGRFTRHFNLIVPLDRCVARLIERYQLPWLCKTNLQRYIMTGRVEYLQSIFPFDIEIDSVTTAIGEAIAITVDGIDEFMTKRQWNEIFEKYIKPWQKYYWERRGEIPHSKQQEEEVLMQPWGFEIYNYIYNERVAGRKCGVDLAIEKLSNKEQLSHEGVDRSTALRRVKNLDILLQPLD